MKVVLVYNPGSGSSSSLSELQKLFADASVEILEAVKLRPGFKKHLSSHIEKGEIIAVVGGDGSISAIANLLVGTNAALMPLPGGTLNHFTKDLGIPQSLPEALAYFKGAKKSKIDTGAVGSKVFINNSSIGIYSDSLAKREAHEKRYGKWPAAVASIFMTLFRFRTYTVTLSGKRYITPLVFVGNNLYKPSGLAFKRSTFTDGRLCVYMILGNSRQQLVRAALSLILGRKNLAKTLKSFSAKSLTITTRKPLRVSRDGEHEKMAPPLTYTLQKASLYVLRR